MSALELDSLGLTLDEITEILALHKNWQPPCVHVLDRKIAEVDGVIEYLQAGEPARGVGEAARKPYGRVCGIIQRSRRHKEALAPVWHEGRQMDKVCR